MAALAGGDPPAGFVAGDTATEIGLRPVAKPAPATTFPRGADKHPDFTGIWYAGIRGFAALDDSTIAIPLTPDYQAVRALRSEALANGKPYLDFVALCQAFGMPRVMSYGNFEIVQRPHELWVVTEVLHEVRRIYIDKRKHGELQDYSFDGVSSGHWEGDTLVVETTKLRAGYFDLSGAPHSDRLKVTERIRMVNRNALEDEMTMTDPVALQKPWVIVQRYERRPADFELSEYICTENNVEGTAGSAALDDPKAMLPASAVSDSQ